MLRNKHLVGLILIAALMATLIPFSAMVYAQRPEEKRAEKFVELAERAGEKVGNFIDIIYANDTAIDTITEAGLYGELEGNKTLFETWGLGNLTEAHDALEASDYPGAIGNATEALGVFREVFKALNIILAEAGVARGELIDAQGLIEAMKRALDRIERIRGLEGVPDEVLAILDSAEEYLDVETAIVWLSEGNVNQTAWNLTQANQLISLAHSSLKRRAGELNVKRIESYLNVTEKLCDRLERLVDKAVERGLAGAAELKADILTAETLIGEAKDAFAVADYSEAIAKLIEARNRLKDVQRALLELRRV
jgi:hypothetical protein